MCKLSETIGKACKSENKNKKQKKESGRSEKERKRERESTSERGHSTEMASATRLIGLVLLGGVAVHGFSRCGDGVGSCVGKTSWPVDVLCESAYDCNGAEISGDAYCGRGYSCGKAVVQGNAHCVGLYACGLENTPVSNSARAATISGDVYCYTQNSCYSLTNSSVSGCCHALDPSYCFGVPLCANVDIETLERKQLENDYVCGSETPKDCWFVQAVRSISCTSQGACKEVLFPPETEIEIQCQAPFSCDYFALRDHGSSPVRVVCQGTQGCKGLDLDLGFNSNTPVQIYCEDEGACISIRSPRLEPFGMGEQLDVCCSGVDCEMFNEQRKEWNERVDNEPNPDPSDPFMQKVDMLLPCPTNAPTTQAPSQAPTTVLDVIKQENEALKQEIALVRQALEMLGNTTTETVPAKSNESETMLTIGAGLSGVAALLACAALIATVRTARKSKAPEATTLSTAKVDC